MTTAKGDPKPKATPRATIEGSAEDVTPAPEESKSPAQTAKAETAAVAPAKTARTRNVSQQNVNKQNASKEGASKESTSKATSSSSKKPSASATSKETPDAVKKSASKDEPTAVPKPVPSASNAVGMAKLVTAGAFGGVISLALLFAVTAFEGPARDWLSNVSGATGARQSARDATELAKSGVAEALANQDTQNARISDVIATSATLQGDVSELKTKTANIEQIGEQLADLAALPAQTSSLGLRLSANETRLESLAIAAEKSSATVNSLARALDEAAKAGTSSAAISTGLSRALARLEALEPQITTLNAEISRLHSIEANVAQMADPSGVEAKVTALSSDVAALATRLKSDETNTAAAQAANDLERLERAIDGGLAFSTQLAPFANEAVAAQLADYASAGVASVEVLLSGLADLPGEDITSETSEGAFGSLLGLLGGAVRVTRAGDAVLKEEPIAAARNALLAGEPGKAAQLVSAAKQGPKVDEWVEKAQARSKVLALVSDLKNSLADALAADLSPPGG